MRLLEEWFPKFVKELDNIDRMIKNNCLINGKIYQLICFALAIHGHYAFCERKYLKGALDADAMNKEITYNMALVFRESAGNNYGWVQDVLANHKYFMKNIVNCC